MNKIMKVFILCMSLLFVQATICLTVDVQAAEKTMYVKAKGDIVLREKPNKDAKILGTIKNHSPLKVISTSKGWSYVNTGKIKGYVYASALVSKNPKTINTVTKGLIPANDLSLKYSPSFSGEETENFRAISVDAGAYLEGVNGLTYLYVENKKGFALVTVPGGDEIFNITYPVVEGKNSKENYIAVTYDGFEFKTRNILIESTSKTVKVKAGTFKNVVVTKNVDGYKTYIAPGIGIIKQTDEKGKTITELISFENIR